MSLRPGSLGLSPGIHRSREPSIIRRWFSYPPPRGPRPHAKSDAYSSYQRQSYRLPYHPFYALSPEPSLTVDTYAYASIEVTFKSGRKL